MIVPVGGEGLPSRVSPCPAARRSGGSRAVLSRVRGVVSAVPCFVLLCRVLPGCTVPPCCVWPCCVWSGSFGDLDGLPVAACCNSPSPIGGSVAAEDTYLNIRIRCLVASRTVGALSGIQESGPSSGQSVTIRDVPPPCGNRCRDERRVGRGGRSLRPDMSAEAVRGGASEAGVSPCWRTPNSSARCATSALRLGWQ